MTALESLPAHSGLPASTRARIGPTRSPRSRSVVVQAQIETLLLPSREMSSVLT